MSFVSFILLFNYKLDYEDKNNYLQKRNVMDSNLTDDTALLFYEKKIRWKINTFRERPQQLSKIL